jgi:hypothetical protein
MKQTNENGKLVTCNEEEVNYFFDVMYDSDSIFDILDEAGIDLVSEFGVDDDVNIQDIMDDSMDDFLQYVVDEHPEIVKQIFE